MKKSKKNKNFFLITNREIYAIIDYMKETNDIENLLIFYFLFIKGLNYSNISRILITNFKKDLSYLIIKKGIRNKYKIHYDIRLKILDFIKSQDFKNKFFFYNKIKDKKGETRALFIKRQFKRIVDNCFWISNNRKNNIINYFATTRKVKWGFDDTIFINYIQFQNCKEDTIKLTEESNVSDNDSKFQINGVDKNTAMNALQKINKIQDKEENFFFEGSNLNSESLNFEYI